MFCAKSSVLDLPLLIPQLALEATAILRAEVIIVIAVCSLSAPLLVQLRSEAVIPLVRLLEALLELCIVLLAGMC